MKRVLVTGASSGIGYETVQTLLEGDYAVVAISRSLGRLSDLASHFSTRLTHIPLNLTCFDEYDEAFKDLGKIDGFVHSAGIVINNPIKYFNLEKYNAVINLNQTAPLVLLNKFVKNKSLSSGSSVVFVSSINGPKVAIKGCSAYAASKSALLGIARVLALELASTGVRVNSVLPGMVQTELVEGLNQLTDEAINIDKARYPLGNRYASPREISNAIEFLLSDRSSFITGQELVVDGGYCVN